VTRRLSHRLSSRVAGRKRPPRQRATCPRSAQAPAQPWCLVLEAGRRAGGGLRRLGRGQPASTTASGSARAGAVPPTSAPASVRLQIKQEAFAKEEE